MKPLTPLLSFIAIFDGVSANHGKTTEVAKDAFPSAMWILDGIAILKYLQSFRKTNNELTCCTF